MNELTKQIYIITAEAPTNSGLNTKVVHFESEESADLAALQALKKGYKVLYCNAPLFH